LNHFNFTAHVLLRTITNTPLPEPSPDMLLCFFDIKQDSAANAVAM